MQLLGCTAIVSAAGFLYAITIVSVTFPTLAAYCHRVRIVGGSVVLTAGEQHSPINHGLVCAHFLGQRTPRQQLLAVAVL